MTTDNPTCPTCTRPLTYVKDVPFEVRSSDSTGFTVPLASSIFRCADHPEHGEWQYFISGTLVPYQKSPDA